VFTISRVKYDLTEDESVKSEDLVKASRTLNMTPFGTKSVPACYDLIAVIDHDGPCFFAGHYTANVRRAIDSDSFRWYKFDDAKVSPMTSDQIITKNAFVLFYEKH